MQINNLLEKLQKQAQGLNDVPKPYIEAVNRQYLSALNDINKELSIIASKLEGIDPKDAVKLQNELFKHNRLNNLRIKIQQILNDSQKVSRSSTSQAIKESLKEGYYSQGFAYYNTFQGAGININFGMFDANAINASMEVITGVNRKITGYIFKNQDSNGKWIWEQVLKENHAKAYRQINNAITQGLIKGNGFNKTSREVKKLIFGDGKPKFNLTSAIERIIRTESGKARSLGDVLAYDKVQSAADRLGVKVYRIWQATLDNRVRDNHLSLHNQPENENGQWIVGGEPTDAPRLSGSASEDINCRCNFATVTEGLESSFDESKVAKNLNKEKYEIWLKTQSK